MNNLDTVCEISIGKRIVEKLQKAKGYKKIVVMKGVVENPVFFTLRFSEIHDCLKITDSPDRFILAAIFFLKFWYFLEKEAEFRDLGKNELFGMLPHIIEGIMRADRIDKTKRIKINRYFHSLFE